MTRRRYPKIRQALWGYNNYETLPSRMFFVDETHPVAYKDGVAAIAAALDTSVTGIKVVQFGDYQAFNLVFTAKQVIPANIQLHLVIPKTSFVFVQADTFDFVFQIAAAGSLFLYGGGSLQATVNLDQGAVEVAGGTLDIDGADVYSSSIIGDYQTIKVTSGSVKLRNSIIWGSTSGGPTIDFTAIASVPSPANYINNCRIISDAGAGISHNTGLTDFPLFNSTVLSASGLNNVALALGNDSNYIQ